MRCQGRSARSCCGVLVRGAIIAHEVADFRLGFRPKTAALVDLADKRLVVQSQFAKAGMRDFMSLAERLNFGEKIIHDPAYKLDQSNGQGWICPPFAKRLDWANFCDMPEAINIETIRAGLRRVMTSKGVKPTTLSLMVGRNRTLVKDLLEKTNDVSLGTLTKLADALGVEVSDLLTANNPADPIPNEEELARMIHRAMDELPVGVSFADYPSAVSTNLHGQLRQYQAHGGFRETEGAEIAPDRDAPLPKPKSSDALAQ